MPRCFCTHSRDTSADPEGGGGGGPDHPWKITKISGSLAILVRIPLKSKLRSQLSMLGDHRPARETAFRWRFADGPLMAADSGIWILPPLIKLKLKKTT